MLSFCSGIAGIDVWIGLRLDVQYAHNATRPLQFADTSMESIHVDEGAIAQYASVEPRPATIIQDAGCSESDHSKRLIGRNAVNRMKALCREAV